MASPSRRSSRKKQKVSYDENVVKIHPDEEAEKPKRSRRAPPKKRQFSSSEDSSSSDESSVARKPPPSKKRKSSGSKRGPVADRTCPHCGQVSSSKAGLKYHVDHFVCRPELNPNRPPGKRRGRKRLAPKEDSDDDDDESQDEKAVARKPRARGRPKKSTTKKEYKRERGAVKDRTCPHCKRVFTSILGKDYHVNNKVCTTKKPSKAAAAATPFPTLEPGTMFVTSFGVVQVVADNRATPVPQPPAAANNKKKPPKPKNVPHQRGAMALSIKTRVQRARLGQMYEYNRITQQGVFRTYFGGDPRMVAAEGDKKPRQDGLLQRGLDQEYPEGSFPDRMVECVLIPDERTWDMGEEYDSDVESKEDASMETEASKPASADENADSSEGNDKSPYGMKLFLRRRLLKEPYVASTTVYPCDDCGAPFTSKVGYNYHTRAEVCVSKAKKVAAATERFLESVEDKATIAMTRRSRPERKKAKKNVPVYPQVWLSLGFNFVATKPYTKPDAASLEKEEDEPEPLDDVLQRLKNELKREQDRSLGAIYPGVFDHLQFRRPPPKWTIVQEQERRVKRNEAMVKKKKAKELERLRSQNASRPVVDVQVLADEIDAGRYPSMKRFDGNHEADCAICKKEKDETLLLCDFCPRVVHLKCLQEKHIVKDPEPQDDFMCQICIGYIQDRRKRAEKRRVEKQKAALKKSGQPFAAMSTEVVLEGESDYHDVAALGHELRDLSELIRDAQGRLREAIGVSKLNDARRAMLM